MKNWKRPGAIAAAVSLIAVPLMGCQSDSREKIFVYNWGEYISNESDTYTLFGQDFEITDVVADFEEKFPQYDVVYSTFDDNEKMYAKLDTETYDIIIPSEYMVTRLMREDKIQELDHAKLPNVEQYMNKELMDIPFSEDPEVDEAIFDYAVPYFFTTVGLVYNTDDIQAPADNSPEAVWGVLFDEQWQNRIGMYNSMRESIGAALNYLGYSLNSMDETALSEARELLINQRRTVQPIVGIDELKDKYISGELAAGIAWSGDHTVIQQRLEEGGEDPQKIQYILPEGSNISVDMMVIPKVAQNVDGAHAFINYMYETEVAVKNAVYVGYSSPHTEAVKQLPAELTSNKSYYPDAELLDTLEVYYSSPEIDAAYDEIWQVYLAN